MGSVAVQLRDQSCKHEHEALRKKLCSPGASQGYIADPRREGRSAARQRSTLEVTRFHGKPIDVRRTSVPCARPAPSWSNDSTTGAAGVAMPAPRPDVCLPLAQVPGFFRTARCRQEFSCNFSSNLVRFFMQAKPRLGNQESKVGTSRSTQLVTSLSWFFLQIALLVEAAAARMAGMERCLRANR